jgi:uncharacterized protein YdbL (DUF1318 family)
MKSLSFIRLVILSVAFALGSAAMVQAQDLNAIRARMEQRQGSIDSLKDRGVVGETNRGYLEARGAATAADQQVISAENADRGQVYASIASKTGTNSETVGRARAKHIAANSKAGVWIQDAGGEWRQKG